MILVRSMQNADAIIVSGDSVGINREESKVVTSETDRPNQTDVEIEELDDEESDSESENGSASASASTSSKSNMDSTTSSEEFEEMPESLKEKIELKFPAIVGEIFNCQIVQMLDTLLDVHKTYLSLLFAFLTQHNSNNISSSSSDTNDNSDAVFLSSQLTKCWCYVVLALFRRNPKTMLHYLKSQNGSILKQLIALIGDQNIVDLLIAIGISFIHIVITHFLQYIIYIHIYIYIVYCICTYTYIDRFLQQLKGWDPVTQNLHGLEEVSVWMFENDLINQLIDMLSPTQSSDMHDASSYILMDIISKADKAPNMLLLNEVMSPHSVQRLVTECILQEQIDMRSLNDNVSLANNCRSAMLASLSVLIALLRYHKNAKPTSRVASPLGIVNEMKEFVSESKDKEQGHEYIPFVLSFLCDHWSEFESLFQNSCYLGGLSKLSFSFVQVPVPLGPLRLKIVDLLVAVVDFPVEKVTTSLRSSSLLQTCMQLFWQYPWNNLLHTSVEHLIDSIVNGTSGPFKQILFEKCDLLNQLLHGYQSNQQHFQQFHIRLGYIGHLIRIANTIVKAQQDCTQIRQYCCQNALWMNFVHNELSQENDKLKIQLG
ncbi:hypothetical protein RFI_11749 [Reticulomyxa filosa]|uniref:Uncharacterized protein n=1 Tax=Reticulomyxa filosa TaxID=46433 RepID=X6NJ86_RETFI|nr:hypothetical protein RFI_11749 [Reticulomyxa filosa]|eukprot:ETO25387.1 hypothetical protein RFI_11749 [Reticulomyxa filosa]